MKKRTDYVVAGIVFSTKKKLSEHCSSILRKYSLNDDVNDDDAAFLHSLLERHPERDQKVGVGVRRFFVGPNDYGRKCFWLERVDGTKTDFSFMACITPPRHEDDVRQALRSLIEKQIIAFRDRAFAVIRHVPCAITGELVTTDDAHVDHQPPTTFDELVKRFLAERSMTFGDVAIVPTADGDTVCRLVDDALARAWMAFHEENAVLQIATKRANFSQGKG
ncbi:MAG: DCL family protein [Polyangiaceae bacterium]|nr:DCL family protein [Polyangiaceae bacterium]